MSTHNIAPYQDPGIGLVLHNLKAHAAREKYLVIALLLLWTLGMGAYLYYSPVVYQEDIQFLLNNNRAPDVVSPEAGSGPVARDYVDESTVATEIQIMSSTDVLRAVAIKCGLIDEKDGTAAERTLRRFQKTLKVSPVLKANMIKATYSSSNPKEVAAVLTALAEVYLNRHLQLHSSSGTFELFAKQAQEYQDQLKELQDRLSDFHHSRNIVLLGEQKGLTLRKMSDLEASLKETDAAHAANLKRIATIHGEIATLGTRITTQARTVPNQYSLERLNTMLVEFQNRRTDLLAKYQPTDRLVLEVDQQIADTRRALAAANIQSTTEETTDVNPLRQSLEGELAKAELNDAEYRSRRASLVTAISSYRSGLNGLENDTAGDDQLARQIKEAEDNFFLYSKKREEARITEAMDRRKIANVALVQTPRIPSLPLPKPSVTFDASYALGCLLILGVGLLKGAAHQTVHMAWELEGLTGLPVLAVVPDKHGVPVLGLRPVPISELNS